LREQRSLFILWLGLDLIRYSVSVSLITYARIEVSLSIRRERRLFLSLLTFRTARAKPSRSPNCLPLRIYALLRLCKLLARLIIPCCHHRGGINDAKCVHRSGCRRAKGGVRCNATCAYCGNTCDLLHRARMNELQYLNSMRRAACNNRIVLSHVAPGSGSAQAATVTSGRA